MNLSRHPIIVLLLLVACTTCTVDAQYISTSGKQISFAAMDRFLEEQLDSLKLPALSIAFITNGKIVYHRTLGMADSSSGRKTDDHSMFEAASLSKPVFAYLVMKQVEKGKLHLDTPLYRYLAFPDIARDERYKRITARMVLSHMTGFPNWRWYDKVDTALHIKDGDMYMLHDPGTFGYSGEGYHYLGRVVAYLNGGTLKDLESIFLKEVAAPLHMQHSFFTWDNYIGQHKVTGYQNGKVFGKKWPNAPPDEDSTIFGAASTLHTDAVDYARFLIAIMDYKGLKKATFDEMLTQQSFIRKEDLPYWGGIAGWSMGFAVEPTDHGTRYSHGGDNGGFQAGCMFYKQQKSGYVFFTNCDHSGEFYVKLRTFLGEMNPR